MIPPSFWPRHPGHVHRDLGPEMGVAAVKDQPVFVAHLGLHIQRKLQRVHLAGFGAFACDMVVPFIDPGRAARALQVEPVGPGLAHAAQRIEESAGIGQQHVIGGLIVFQLLVTAVDADQRLIAGEERRVAEIHLIVEPPADHQHQIGLVNGGFGRVVLVEIGQPHIGFAFLAQQLGMVGHVEDRDPQGAADLFQPRLRISTTRRHGRR
jgi:hypothetical protein